MSDPSELFERFLESYHERRGDIESFCGQHPEHEERFRKWWDQLLHAGEVSSSTSSAGDGLPSEGATFGSYRIRRELGRGSQGTVFLAEDTRLERHVALKVLPEHRMRGRDSARRFAREAELASRLDHPGICAVYERGTLGKTAFLAMRFVEGETLAGWIAARKRRRDTGAAGVAVRIGDADLDEAKAIAAVLGLFEQVGAALHAAHEARLIHRDVKPGNVIVDGAASPVLLDFGLARDVEEPELTITGDLVGTPAYMSPEQLAAQRIELDRRTDVYSLGATLYECLTLHRPFEAPTRNELYQEILTAEPPDPRRFNPAIPRDLVVVLQTALEKDRRRRYQTAQDFADELCRVRRHEPIRARPAGPLLRAQRWAQRNPAVAISAAAVFLALAVGLLMSLRAHAARQRATAAFGRLADAELLERAREIAPSLRPAVPARIAAIEDWLERYGEPLRRGLPEHGAHLARLRAEGETVPLAADAPALVARRAERDRLREEIGVYRLAIELARLPVTAGMLRESIASHERRLAQLDAGEDEPRTWRFSGVEQQVAHDGLARLVADLEAFVGPGGLLERVRRDLEWARAVERRSVEEYRDRWEQARREVAASERYAGVTLAPQIGLVPLGPDPRSGLQEFAFLRSGAVPARDSDTKRLNIDDDSAIVLVLLPGGTFRMGAASSGGPIWEDEVGDVTLDPFFAGKHELSRAQWARLASAPPPESVRMAAAGCAGPAHPNESVSWLESRRLLRDHGLDLPTEAQWEYAARGKTATARWWLESRWVGRQQELPPANVRDAAYYDEMPRGPRPRHDDGVVFLAEIATFRPNPFGLHHVLGNVAEWCREASLPAPLSFFERDAGDAYHRVPLTNSRVVRGGAFDLPYNQVRVTARARRRQEDRHVGVGLRVVRTLD